MGAFLGGIFKFAGGLIMVVTVVCALVLVMIVMHPNTPRHSLMGNVAAFALLVGVPFLIGRLFYGIGKKLQQADGEAPTQPPPGNQARESVAPRRPAQSEFKRWKETVDVDGAAETGPWAAARKPAPAPTAKPATAWKGEKKPDPFAMGVDTLYDPDRDAS